MTPSSFSPSSAMLVGVVLTIVYMFIGVMAAAHTKPDDGSRGPRMGLWWPFRHELFDEAGRRLCGPGKVLFIGALLAFVAAAWAFANT